MINYFLSFIFNKIFLPVFVFLSFIVLILPLGLCFKIINKNLLEKKFNKKLKTYWIVRKKRIQTK